MDLTPSEKTLLKELQQMHEEGMLLETYISKRLYGNLAMHHEDDGYFTLSTDPAFMDLYTTFISLADKGLLSSGKTSEGVRTFEALTPYGRHYFEMEKQRKDELKKALWSNRRFTIIWGIIVIILGGVMGYISGHITLPWP